jgi:hypothetical protein
MGMRQLENGEDLSDVFGWDDFSCFRGAVDLKAGEFIDC